MHDVAIGCTACIASHIGIRCEDPIALIIYDPGVAFLQGIVGIASVGRGGAVETRLNTDPRTEPGTYLVVALGIKVEAVAGIIEAATPAFLVGEGGEVVVLARLLCEAQGVALVDGALPGVFAILLIVVVATPLCKGGIDFALRDTAFGLVAIELVERAVVVVAQRAEKRSITTAGGHAIVVDLGLVVDDVARRCIMHGIEGRLGGDVEVGAQRDLHLVALGLLGGDDDDAIGSQGAIDRRSSGILEHGDGLDVVGIDVGQRHRGHHVIDDNKGLGADAARKGAHTTQDGRTIAGVGIDVDAQTSHLALKRGGEVLVHHRGELGRIDHGIGSRGALLTDALVTCRDDDGLVELGDLATQHDVDDITDAGRNLVGLHANHREVECTGIITDANGVLAILIGDNSIVGARNNDRHACQGFLMDVGDSAVDESLLGLYS